MPRDANTGKRDALVLTGGLLAFYSLVGIIYVDRYRVPDPQCAQGELLAGACTSVLTVLLPVLVVGAALVAVGLWRFAGRPDDLEGHLHFGTGTHFVIGLLVSLVAVTGLGFVYIVLQERDLAAGEFISVTVAGTDYLLSFLMKLAFAGSLLLLVAVLGLYLTQARMRGRFLDAAAAMGEEDLEALEAAEAVPPLPPDLEPEAPEPETAPWTPGGGPTQEDPDAYETPAAPLGRIAEGPSAPSPVPDTSEEVHEDPDRWRDAFNDTGEDEETPATGAYDAYQEDE